MLFLNLPTLFRPSLWKSFLLITFLLVPLLRTLGQRVDSLKSQVLDTIVITSTRLGNLPLDLPLSVSSIRPKAISTSQQLSLKEQLYTIAGIYSQNAYNYAQDLRISIRGFGAGSAFGINGIKILVDGVPETTPDGQGQVDNLNLGLIKQLEVIKSASSAMYGNASGGVIQITTEENFRQSFLEVNSAIGSFNFSSHSLQGGLALGKTRLTGLARYLGYGGFRDHSRLQQFNGALRVNHNFNDRTRIAFFAELMDSPVAEDAGGLTFDESQADFSAARQANLDYDAGEAVGQVKTGSRFSWEIDNKAKLKAYFFYNRRQFSGKQPFEFGGIIDLQRNYFGQGADFELTVGGNRLKLGYDALFQNDDRQRFANLLGEQGSLSFHQKEIFHNLGLYFLDHIKIGRVRLNAGFRIDINQIEAIDLNRQAGDNSGSLNLNNLSPMLGLGYQLTKALFIFGNYSYGFKTPTLNQLSNRPDGAEGFNELRPQLANNYELGLKGNGKWYQAEVALFYIKTNDDLVPYELAGFPNRTFFRNVGQTNRLGSEAALTFFLRHLSLTGSYTYANFQYEKVVIDNVDLTGKQLPGIPKHFANLNLQYSRQGLVAGLNINYSGNLFADDQNLTGVKDYLLVNLKIDYRLEFEQFSFHPYLGINNLFNVRYFDNIRINAFGQRYYEPAPGINFYLGLAIRIKKQ